MTISDKPRPDITEKIKKVRALRGYSQTFMAHRLGLPGQKEYSRMENKGEQLSIQEMGSIADVLEIPMPDLLGFDERVFFNNCKQSYTHNSRNVYYEASIKERELYEQRIRHLEEEVVFLRDRLKR